MTIDPTRLSGPSTVPPPTKPRRFRSLASRLVLLGVLQLALLVLVTGVVLYVAGPREEAHPHDFLDRAGIGKLEAVSADMAKLQAALEDLREHRIEVSIYDADRHLIASNVEPALAIPLHRRPPGESRHRGPPMPHDHDASHHHGPILREGAMPHDGSGTAIGGSGAAMRGSGGAIPHEESSAGSSGAMPRDGSSAAIGGSGAMRGAGGAMPRDGSGNAMPRDDVPPPSPDNAHVPRPPSDDTNPRFDEGPPGGRPPKSGTPRSLVMRISIAGKPAFLVARGVFGEPPGLILPIAAVAASFLVLVITGLLTARWIARPIERLSRTARAIGEGDLTARSRLERSDEIGELGHQIDEMADRLARVLATERELLANVAHELRTPLSRIGVALDLAAEGDAAAARTALDEIAVDVGELETITDDVLTAMRFEVAGGSQLPLRKAMVECSSIVAGAADRFRLRHSDRSLEVHVEPGLPQLHVDAMLVRRVLDNLLANAHKYSPDRDAKIELSAARDGDRVKLVVRDRGMGIAAADLPRVFTAFFRADRSRSREGGGVGLGLTLAKRIVEGHDGTIAIESTLGTGTTVTVMLPAA